MLGKKILIFTDEYDYSHFTFIYNEIKSLEKFGNNVLVICERIGKLKQDDTNYICISRSKNKLLSNIYLQAQKRNLSFILSFFPFIRRRRKIIAEYKPDIIHAHFGDTATRFFFPLKRQISNIPFVVSFHGFDASSLLNFEFYVNKLKKMVVHKNVFIIYVSKKLRQNLLEKSIPLTEGRNFLLHYGVDLSFFKPEKKLQKKTKVFMQISSFAEKKGHKYTLLAFKKLIENSAKEVKFIVGGEGPLEKDIKKQCHELGLDEYVEFPGRIKRTEIVSYLSCADYFLHHSITAKNGDQEGIPNAIIEAMAMELPVISTFHSGIPELIDNKRNGLLVEEKEIDKYAKAMEEILSWKKIPENRTKVMEQFSLEGHTKSLLDIYSRILSFQLSHHD